MAEVGQIVCVVPFSILKWGLKLEKIDFFKNPSCKLKNIASMLYPHLIGPFVTGLMVPEFNPIPGGGAIMARTTQNTLAFPQG